MTQAKIILLVAILSLLVPVPGLAIDDVDPVPGGSGWVQCNPRLTIGQPGSCDLCALLATVQTVLNALIELVFVAAVGLIIYNGVLFYFSQGNPGKLQAIYQNLLNVGIGIAILLSAWVIINTLIRFFAGVDSPLLFWNTLNC